MEHETGHIGGEKAVQKTNMAKILKGNRTGSQDLTNISAKSLKYVPAWYDVSQDIS